MSPGYARCGAIRASFLRCLPPIAARQTACYRHAGHDGNHRDLDGGEWFVTPEIAEAVAVTVAAAALRDTLRQGRG